METKTFAIGDIHGRFEALKQCLKKSKFDYDKDTLIVLGDVVDGGKDTKECVDLLLGINNLILIKGNHDEWFQEHIKKGFQEEMWIQQGGAFTLQSYGAEIIDIGKNVSESSHLDMDNVWIPASHQNFFNKGKYYHIKNNMIFVHGGFNPLIKLEKNPIRDFLWDRHLIKLAKEKSIYRNDKLPINKKRNWKKVFIGHTTTQDRLFGKHQGLKPVILNNLYCLDTGAGWSGRLTIMNIDTEEYWQSDVQAPSGCRRKN